MLIVKSVEAMDDKYLHHENQIYNHLYNLQEEYIPVCLSLVSLIKLYYYNSGIYKYFMFLSYSRQPVLRKLGEVSIGVANKILAALCRLYQHRVLHCDAEPRNVLYDKRTGICMIVDLMLAEFHARQPLGPINVNGRNRKRKWAPRKHETDVFAVEAQSLRASL